MTRIFQSKRKRQGPIGVSLAIKFRILSLIPIILLALVVQSSGCTTAHPSESPIVRTAAKPLHTIVLHVELADKADTEPLTSRLIRKLDLYDLRIVSAAEAGTGVANADQGTALLKISEVDRRIETVAYRRTYGRKSLTQMRGLKSRDVPVITLRTTVMDAVSGQTLFQRNYIAQGPWYADSASVLASLAGSVVTELENSGFISAR
jgi:hypothetical protein